MVGIRGQEIGTLKNAFDRPLRFVPFLRPMVWGGRRLGESLHKELPTAEAYGESWEVSDHPLHRSVVADGPHAGRTLEELMRTDGEGLLGPAAGRHERFPWLIKFLDASDWLSIQVHPDEEAVKRLLPGEGSKTEAWFILAAEPGSRVYAGLRPGVTREDLRAAVAAGTAAECLHSFEPLPGQCVYLPAGTVHAVGGGVLFAEVQQTSDATFRLFDWNRKDAAGRSRTLHVDESLECIDWKKGPVRPVRAEQFGHGGMGTLPAPGGQVLVDGKYFRLGFRRPTRIEGLGGTGRMQAVVVVEGRGKWRFPGAEGRLAAGDVCVLPAALPRGEVIPEGGVGLLTATLP